MVSVCWVIAGGCDAAVPTIKTAATAPKTILAIMFLPPSAIRGSIGRAAIIVMTGAQLT
jgi:hypothetical protein